MLRNIMKAALAASLVFVMSPCAHAEDSLSLGGAFAVHFGQYNSGNEGYTSNFKSFEEVQVKVRAKVGKLSVYHEMESATDDDFVNTQTKLSYETPVGLLSLGNVVGIGTIPMSSAGWAGSNIPYSTRRALLVSGYSENEGLQLTVPLEGLGMVQFTMYEDSDNAGNASNKDVAALAGGTVPSSTEGSSMQLAADLWFGDIGVRAGYATAKTDDPADDADDALSTTNMMLGVWIGLSKNMSVAFDYATAKSSYDAWSDDMTFSSMDADFTMKGVGPGKLVLSYDMQSFKGAEKILDLTVTSVLFDMPVGKSAGVQVGYIANTYKPEDATFEASYAAVAGRSEGTETFLGAGFYANF